MTIKKLDSSHRCLLDHFDTYRRMESSYNEIDDYITDVLQDLANELNRQQSLFQFNPKTIPKKWLEIELFPRWKGFPHSLLSAGIEDFEVASIIRSATIDRCRAYVYSRHKENAKDRAARAAVAKVLAVLQPPDGFTAGSVGGYLFIRDLGNLSVDEFCDRQKLTAYFVKPLKLLLDWLAQNKARLQKRAK